MIRFFMLLTIAALFGFVIRMKYCTNYSEAVCQSMCSSKGQILGKMSNGPITKCECQWPPKMTKKRTP